MEKIIKSEYIYKGKIIKLRKDVVRLPNDNFAEREVIEHNGGVTAVCVTKNKEIFFVKQYRIPYQDYILELPAGKIELGENPDLTIIRELHEEIGVLVKKIEKVGYIYPSPGYTNEVIHMYYTDDYEEDQISLDEDEFLDVVLIKIDEVFRMISKNQIKDAKSLVCLFRLKDKLQSL